MKIKDIESLDFNETTFKLNKGSITAKVNGKTKAVINDVQQVKGLQFNKLVDLKTKLRFNFHTLKMYDNLYVDMNNNLYCIVDNNYHEITIRLSNDGSPEELNRLREEITELTTHNINVLYLNLG